ncbi:MAG: hypothetical protein MUC81_09265 [Bacteroidia bacterium]|jgi:hypothetical protein|nr:hypothetical protein [Bacteroidia bacterium]
MALDTQKEVIKELIATTSEGAIEAYDDLINSGAQIKLDEFEIETTYAAETEFKIESNNKISFKMKGFKASFGTKVSRRNTQTYGLKVRFLFVGV